MSRREFLRTAAGAAGVLAGAPLAARVVAAAGSDSLPSYEQSLETPWWLEASSRSLVVDIRSPHVLRPSGLDTSALDEMLAIGIQAVSGSRANASAWRTLLGSAERILIKMNRVGADVIGTNDALLGAILRSLRDGGYDPAAVTLVEASESVRREWGAKAPTRMWGGAIPVGEGEDELAAYVHEADAIINVPLLKSHRIAGMSGAMKNVSHAVIRHPARYHDRRCNPYVWQIVANKEVAPKLRVSIVNALRTVVRNGPDAQPEDVAAHGGLILGQDPVAVDAIGLSVLKSQQRTLGIAQELRVPYIEGATAAKVGRGLRHEVDYVPVRIGS